MIKICTLVFAALCCVSFSYAQINKGSTLLGGTLSVSANNAKNPDTSFNKSTIFTILPSVGFAIHENTVLGFSLLYSHLDAKSYYSFKQNSNTYGAGVFLRKYKTLGKSFYYFTEGNLLFDFNSYNYSNITADYTNPYKSNGFDINLNISPGVAYTLTKNMQLEASLQNLLSIGYSNRNEKLKSNESINYKLSSFNLSSSFNPQSLGSVSFGVRFLLNK